MSVAIDSFLMTLKQHEFENSFNPYRNVCSVYDHYESPVIRTKILEDILGAACSAQVDAIWIGRDLGHRGGRRTGLAFTDDLSFERHLSRWGLASRHLTNGPMVKERSATVIWELLNKISQNVFLWNVFPFHPHQNNNPFSNRAHNSIERKFGTKLLEQLVDLLKPTKLVAIGNDAANVARTLSVDCDIVHVRHPSYGGQTKFIQQISAVYEIPVLDRQPLLI